MNFDRFLIAYMEPFFCFMLEKGYMYNEVMNDLCQESGLNQY